LKEIDKILILITLFVFVSETFQILIRGVNVIQTFYRYMTPFNLHIILLTVYDNFWNMKIPTLGTRNIFFKRNKKGNF